MSKTEKAKTPDNGTPSPRPTIPYSFDWGSGLESPRTLTAKMLGVSGTPLENYRTLPHSAAIFPRILRISCTRLSRVKFMTPANLVRPLRPALSVQRRKAKVPSYAVASAVGSEHWPQWP